MRNIEFGFDRNTGDLSKNRVCLLEVLKVADAGGIFGNAVVDNVTLNHAILRNAILKNGVLCSVLVRNPVLRNPVLGKPVLGCECISAIGVAYDGGIESIVCSRSDVLVRLTGFGHLGKRFGRLGNKP